MDLFAINEFRLDMTAHAHQSRLLKFAMPV
jgi:hypothetical protein